MSLIVAADTDDVIGRGPDLPWHLPEDLRRFKRLTHGHVVVMGRRTYDSIVGRLGHPLPGRFSVVVSRSPGNTGGPPPAGVLFQPDLPAALVVARGIEAFAGRDELFVIGGAEVYTQVLAQVTRVYLTRVHRASGGDVAMPVGWLKPFRQVGEQPGPDGAYTFLTYERA